MWIFFHFFFRIERKIVDKNVTWEKGEINFFFGARSQREENERKNVLKKIVALVVVVVFDKGKQTIFREG